MRVNIYAEEISDNVELITKGEHVGLRFWLYLPATMPDGTQAVGPFIHKPGDDDSSAITFWGRKVTRDVLIKGIRLLDDHHSAKHPLEAPYGIMVYGPFKRHPELGWTRDGVSLTADNAAIGIVNHIVGNTPYETVEKEIFKNEAELQAIIAKRDAEIKELKLRLAEIKDAIGEHGSIYQGVSISADKIKRLVLECERRAEESAQLKRVEASLWNEINALRKRDAELQAIDKALGYRSIYTGAVTIEDKIKRLVTEYIRLNEENTAHKIVEDGLRKDIQSLSKSPISISRTNNLGIHDLAKYDATGGWAVMGEKMFAHDAACAIAKMLVKEINDNKMAEDGYKANIASLSQQLENKTNEHRNMANMVRSIVEAKIGEAMDFSWPTTLRVIKVLP